MDDEPEHHIQLISKRLYDVNDDEELYQPNRYERPSQGRTFCARITRREYLLLLIIVVQFLALCTSAVRRTITTIDREDALGLYSPAKEAVEYQVKVFTPGRSNKTIYQGLSIRLGERYTTIPRAQAVLLPNRTYPIRQEPGYYMAMLDVFHQLHCLVRAILPLRRGYTKGMGMGLRNPIDF
ncbi:hypothetical protein CVT26_001122 [Gymnopilus dilepis]|uniref:Uncharacterized protein n=1 Tax=Gymnopilus dilepis TaxID=231916 RepID=A0A409Y1X5_9AGAR|nr:hypothetical protein CVT26_001122 [Gymnopilus dilepis]